MLKKTIVRGMFSDSIFKECVMVKRLSLPVVFAVSALTAMGGNALSFAGNPMLAGRASLTENGFVVTRTMGVANFSPDFQIPVQVTYESSSERKGIFGYGWRSPQLESRAWFAKGGAHWTTQVIAAVSADTWSRSWRTL